ncbi:MAG: PAS domain S-box protein [Opitutae bacterium]|nr:PAS domain S-box protein [Opitutae bacterium]
MNVSAIQPTGVRPDSGPPSPDRGELPKRFEAIVNTSTDYFTLIDSDYVYLAVNDAYCRANGLDRQQLVGRTVAEVWGAEIFEASIRPQLDRCLAGEEIHYQARFEFPRTGLRHFDVSLYPQADRPGVRRAVVITRDITVLLTAESELRASEDRYRALIESANDVIFLLTIDGRIAALNPAFEALTGWPRAEWIGQPFAPLLHPEDQPVALERFRAILGGEPPRRREYRVRKHDGEYAVGEFTLAPQIKDGRRAGICGIGRDITERKRAEADLRLLLETGQIICQSDDLAGATTKVLAHLCQVAGWAVGEVWMPLPDGTLHRFAAAHLPDVPAWAKFQETSASRVFNRERDLPARHWQINEPHWQGDLAAGPDFFRPRQSELAGLKAALVLPLKANELTVGLMAFFLPVALQPDERWRALVHAVAGELGAICHRERTEEQLDRFFNRSIDMHCLAGFDGFLKRVNPAWERTLGYDSAELLRRPYVEFVHPDDRPALLAELGKLQQGQDIAALELRCPCKDGTVKWTLWSASPLSSQRIIIATGRDITGRKRSEEAVLQSEEHYRELFHQAYRMQENLRNLSNRILEIQEQERARISRDLHDEVGQSLTAINVNLAVIQRALGGAPPETTKRIADTRQLLEHTMETVHRFARELRPAMLDDLGLLPAVRSYVKLFAERTGIAVRFQPERANGIERLDAERKTVIYRVVQEGLNNAAKHAHAKQITVTLANSEHRVRLEIRDEGRGFLTDGKASGAGSNRLGLLGIAERVRLVNGDFLVDSAPGCGTTLRIIIPVKPL